MNPAPQYLVADEDGVLTPHPLGLVECTNDQYHSGPGISKSHLDAIAGASPLHYWHKYVNPERERAEPSQALIMGSAIHAIVLEPDLFTGEYMTVPADAPKRATKAQIAAKKPSPDAIASIEWWAAFEKENAGRIILEDEDYQTCLKIRDAVYRHPVAAGLLTGGTAEQSFYSIDKETGELMKCRTDYMHDSGAMIVDLKSTEDASPNGFGKSAANFRYPVQTAWYNGVLDSCFGEHPEDWVFLAVEKKPPFAVGVYFMEYDTIARAQIAARRDFLRIVEHKRSGVWPDYGYTPTPLTLPAWSKL
jgi:hypothetical protein